MSLSNRTLQQHPLIEEKGGTVSPIWCADQADTACNALRSTVFALQLSVKVFAAITTSCEIIAVVSNLVQCSLSQD